MYPAIKPQLQWKFSVGDKVRLLQSKRVFRKGYLPRWTTEIFIVKYRVPTDPPTFKIADYEGKNIIGKFYAKELQKVTKKPDALYDVERIIKSRKRAGKVEHFVKWVGYPDKFNSWTSDIITRNEQSVAQS